MTRFPDYQKLVVQTYEQKKIGNALPYGLKHLTRARLKKECVMRCRKDLNKRDEKIVRDFCGDWNELRNCQAIIRQCDTDRFRPLVNYLKGKSENTDPKNIELLAWLIDFPGRPWEMGKEYPDGMSEKLLLSDTGPVAGNQPTAVNTPASPPADGCTTPADIPVNSENTVAPVPLHASNEKESADAKIGEAGDQVKKGRAAKSLMATVMLSLVLVTGGAWLGTVIDPGPGPGGGCMYWSEDRYKPIACDQEIQNVRIIALDLEKLKNFRKITTPDTITYQSLGKVWYSKIDSKIEFYTSYGEHPVIYGHWLKPITIYIINKYIHPGMLSKSN